MTSGVVNNPWLQIGAPSVAETTPVNGGNSVISTLSQSQIDALSDLVSGDWILEGAVAGRDSGWLPLIGGGFRLAYALDSGTTSTTFSVDISADGVASLAQAFTGSWASSTLYEDTGERLVSNVNAKYFRFNVLSGGPLSVKRLA